MPVQQLIVGCKMFRNLAAFYKRQEYVKDGTKTLVALERPRSD